MSPRAMVHARADSTLMMLVMRLVLELGLGGCAFGLASFLGTAGAGAW